MTALPDDVAIRIGSFCAGIYDFRSLVNVALACKKVHEGLKPILNYPVLVLTVGWNANARFPVSNDVLLSGNVQDHPKWQELQPFIGAWSRIKIIVSLDCAVLENMMEEVLFNDNLQAIFPSLVAVIQHRASVPGTWRVALRRRLSLDTISNIVQSATQTFRPPPRRILDSSQLYRQLDVRALHPEGLPPWKGEDTDCKANRQKFEQVIVRFGDPYGRPDHVANVVAAAECQFGKFCALANSLSSMSQSGLVALQVNRGDIDSLLREFRIWSTRYPSDLSVLIRIRRPRHISHSQEDGWDTTARFFCTRRFSDSITSGTALISVAHTSIVYDPDHGVLQCNKSLKIPNDIVAGPGQQITGSCCGRVLRYVLTLPLPKNRLAWIEPVDDINGADVGLTEAKPATDLDVGSIDVQPVLAANRDDAKVNPLPDERDLAISLAVKQNRDDLKINSVSPVGANNVESKNIENNSVAPRNAVVVRSEGVAVLSGGGTVMHPARDWGRVRLRIERVDGQQGCDGPARPFSDSEAPDAEDWDMI